MFVLIVCCVSSSFLPSELHQAAHAVYKALTYEQTTSIDSSQQKSSAKKFSPRKELEKLFGPIGNALYAQTVDIVTKLRTWKEVQLEKQQLLDKNKSEKKTVDNHTQSISTAPNNISAKKPQLQNEYGKNFEFHHVISSESRPSSKEEKSTNRMWYG